MKRTGMPPSSSRRGSKDVPLTQVLDENFEDLMRVAQSITETLKRPKDRSISRSTLEQLADFNRSDSIEVKTNVRKFLKFYLQVLRWTQTHQPVGLYEKWYETAGCECSTKDAAAQDQEKHIWLEEGSSYLAMKHFDDGSTMIYSAVAKDTTSGWSDGGFKILMSEQSK